MEFNSNQQTKLLTDFIHLNCFIVCWLTGLEDGFAQMTLRWLQKTCLKRVLDMMWLLFCGLEAGGEWESECEKLGSGFSPAAYLHCWFT